MHANQQVIQSVFLLYFTFGTFLRTIHLHNFFLNTEKNQVCCIKLNLGSFHDKYSNQIFTSTKIITSSWQDGSNFLETLKIYVDEWFSNCTFMLFNFRICRCCIKDIMYKYAWRTDGLRRTHRGRCHLVINKLPHMDQSKTCQNVITS